jgi:hypothetical protein
MSDCPYHLTPEDTGERRRRTDLRIRLEAIYGRR